MAVKNNGKVLFSCTEDENLVEVVSKFPCLFDLANPSYKNQLTKDNAWKEVAMFLGRSGKILINYNKTKTLFFLIIIIRKM